MKKTIIILAAICGLQFAFLPLGDGLLLAQSVAINTTGAAPSASALLDVDASPGNNKGILIPRVSLTSTTDITTIASPANSLLVYNTNAAMTGGAVGYWYYNTAIPAWVQLLNGGSPGTAWLLLGNTGTTAGINFIGTTDAKDLVFKTNNTEWMRILSTGNVGIGTSSPARKLEVYLGDIRASNNSWSGIEAQVCGTVHGYFMGIRGRGTLAAPAYPQSGDALAAFIGRDAIDAFTVNYGGGAMYVYANENFSAASKGSYIAFLTADNGTNIPPPERVRIDHNGNVGIGITSPSTKLHIADPGPVEFRLSPGTPGVSGTNTAILRFTGENNGTTEGFVINYTNSGDTYLDNVYVDPSQSNPAIRFRTNTAGTPINAMTITHNGSIGIGTTNPTRRIDIDNGTPGTDGLHIRTISSAPATNPWSIILSNDLQQTNGFNSWKIESRNDGDFNLSNGSSRLWVSNTGNVGIGTASPTEKLHVVGNICATGSIAACSDIRYKKNVSQLTGALAGVMKLQGVNYHWKTEEYPEQKFNSNKQIGFIAQEIENVYPEVVITDANGYKTVDYSRLTPVLVEAFKEQHEKIINLEAENKSLQSAVGSLQTTIQKLETDFNSRFKAIEQTFCAKAKK